MSVLLRLPSLPTVAVLAAAALGFASTTSADAASLEWQQIDGSVSVQSFFGPQASSSLALDGPTGIALASVSGAGSARASYSETDAQASGGVASGTGRIRYEIDHVFVVSEDLELDVAWDFEDVGAPPAGFGSAAIGFAEVLDDGTEIQLVTAVSGDAGTPDLGSERVTLTAGRTYRWTADALTNGPVFVSITVVSGDGPVADLDGDGTVGLGDLITLLSAWGTADPGAPDLDGDGTVGVLDLLVLLVSWGDV